MLRPATPLTILLLAAFACLLISVISTPIVKAIPLATYAGIDFGVFGYCKGTSCSNIEIGYNTASLFTDSESKSFDLPVGTRKTLSAILIIHPIAAFFTLIMLVLAGTAHLHSPSHSPRYLLGVFILSILTLLLTLLSFLIDVLLFVPHMAWGSYIVLAATILVAASGIVSCAMRRTLVSRKARKRRIAENAEMNGENFYNRQGTEATLPPPSVLPVPPTMSGGVGNDNKAPSYATFEETKGGERVSDERMPLTARTPSFTSPEGVIDNREDGIPLQERYGGPPRMNTGELNGPPRRDEYGNLVPPNPGYGARSRDPSQDSQYRNPGGPGPYRGRGGPNGMMYRGRGGPVRGGPGRGGPGFGGRGGYGPPGRGGYGPGPNRGPPRMNGGPMGGMPAGAMMRGGRGGPGAPPGYSDGGYAPPGSRRAPSPGGSYGPYGRNAMAAPSPGGFGQEVSPAGYSAGVAPTQNFAAFQGNPRDSLPRAESPPPLPEDVVGPVGQAIEMDATTGSPSHPPAGFQDQYGPVRDGDRDVAGMVGLQKQTLDRHATVISETSRYSNDESYVPPRQVWAAEGRSSPLAQSAPPVELPVEQPLSRSHRRTSSENYYEDVPPQFAELGTGIPTALPPSLVTGFPPNAGPSSGIAPHPDAYLNPVSSNHNLPHGLDGSNSYEDLQSGSRSPAESDRSNFTSISQRGINPQWNPASGPGGFGPPMNRGPPPSQRNDMILESNPDFNLPGMGPPRRGGMRGGLGGPTGGRFTPNRPTGMVPRSAYDSNNQI